MANAVLHKISYKDLGGKVQIAFDDRFHVLSDYITPAVCKTLLGNPCLCDYSKTAVNLVVSDGIIVGRNMLMPVMLKIGDKYVVAQSGGSYEINEHYRGNGLGTINFTDSILNSEYDIYFGQLYSTTALSIVRKLGLTVFEYPSYYKLCNSKPFFESKGFSGILLNLLTKIFNLLLKFLSLDNCLKLKELRGKYNIIQESSVPDWVENITLKDKHKFMEVHNREWFQWCLDNRFTNCPEDKQSFYSVYDKEGKPQGFFMTKVRFEKSQGNYKSQMRGTIVEWGSFDEEQLSEVDLNRMAVSTFDRRVDNITTVLSNRIYDSQIRKIGFMRHGSFQVSLKPGLFNEPDIMEMDNWRIRYGGCNTIVF